MDRVPSQGFYTPRREAFIVPVKKEDPFAVIESTFAILKKPLIFEYRDNKSGKRYRQSTAQHFERIQDFKTRLFTMHKLGIFTSEKRDAMLELVRTYLRILVETCKKFQEEYNSLEPPKPSGELLSPRSRAKQEVLQAQATLQEAQKAVKVALAKKDACVHTCIADICDVADRFADDEAAIAAKSGSSQGDLSEPPSKLQKVWGFFTKKAT